MKPNLYKELLLRHQDVMSRQAQRIKEGWECLGTIFMWQEIKGVFVLSGRQTGKTTAICNFAKTLEQMYPDKETIIITPYKVMCDYIKELTDVRIEHFYKNSQMFFGIDHSQINLLMDEFTFIENMRELLYYNWHSVTGIGTVRL
jgi:hypothetical protein